MGNYFGVAAPTGFSQNRAGDGPESSRNKRSGAGKDKAAKRAVTETAGITVGDAGTTVGTTDVAGTTTDASGVPGTTAALSTTGGVPPATTPLGGTKKATNTEVTGGSGVTKTKTQTVPKAAAVVAEPPRRCRPTIEDIYGGSFGDDMSKWVVDEGPIRIKTTQLTPEEQAKFKRHVDLIFSQDIVVGARVDFDGDDIMEVMQKVIPYLESERVLIEDVPFDVSIVGDIRGQLFDLNRVFCGDDKDDKPGWERGKKYLFLGNYVGGGRQSLEVIMALFCLKMLYPDNIFLLRGNHEFLKTNLKDFGREINERYEAEGARIIYFQCNQTFFYLSIAAIVGDIYLCAHGGISPGFVTRRHMRTLRKPIFRSTDDVIVHDMTWSDPGIGIIGAMYNATRGTSSIYGYDTLVIAMACMNVKAVFRAHTVVAAGYEKYWGVLYSIYTATSKHNRGAVAVIDAKGKLTMRVLVMDPARVLIEKAYKEEKKKAVEEEKKKRK